MLQNNELEQSNFPIWRLVITEAQFPSNTCHGGRFTYGNANQNRRTGHTISHTTFALAFWRSLYSSTESFIKKGTTNHSYLKGTIWHFSVYLVEWYFPFLYLKINIKALKCLAICFAENLPTQWTWKIKRFNDILSAFSVKFPHSPTLL